MLALVAALIQCTPCYSYRSTSCSSMKEPTRASKILWGKWRLMWLLAKLNKGPQHCAEQMSHSTSVWNKKIVKCLAALPHMTEEWGGSTIPCAHICFTV